jgi:hypothetical protein
MFNVNFFDLFGGLVTIVVLVRVTKALANYFSKPLKSAHHTAWDSRRLPWWQG